MICLVFQRPWSRTRLIILLATLLPVLMLAVRQVTRLPNHYRLFWRQYIHLDSMMRRTRKQPLSYIRRQRQRLKSRPQQWMPTLRPGRPFEFRRGLSQQSNEFLRLSIQVNTQGVVRASRGEKHKRSSPDDDSKIKKKARESTTSSNVTEKKDDVNGFKIPLKPAQERVDRFSSHPSHSYNSAANSSRSAGRGRGSYWRGGRSTYQSSRPSYRSWDFAGQAFNRPPANNRRICNLTEEQFRWLDQMPVSWRRQYWWNRSVPTTGETWILINGNLTRLYCGCL